MLLEELRKIFGKEAYPFASRFPLKNVEGVAFPVFANISLEPSIRSPPLPNFFRHAPFQEEFGNFFKNVHKAVTQHSKANRSSKVKSFGPKSPESPTSEARG